MRKLIFVFTMLVSLNLWAADDVQAALCKLESGKPFVALSREICYGTCPIYTVKIYKDGRIIYNGEKFVKVVGRKESKGNAKEVAELFKKFDGAGLHKLKDAYAGSITDVPTYVLCYSDGSKVKRISDYYGGMDGMPAIVTELEDAIDQVAKAKALTGKD